jgi:predicted ATP-binding protein involved in virulence
MFALTLQSLHLSNYRCFESLTVSFHPKLTVLAASNGAGKTSVLDAVAVALGPFVGAFDEAVGRHFEPDDIRLTRVRETASNEMESAPGGVVLEATGIVPESPSDLRPNVATWLRSLSSPVGAKTTIRHAKSLIDYGKRLQHAVRSPEEAPVVLPLIAYYGTGRLWQRKKLQENRLSRTSRTIGYTDCLDPASSYKSFVEWFKYWNFNAKNSRIEALERNRTPTGTEFDAYIQSVSDAVNACLAPSGWRNISYSFSRETMVAEHAHHGELPVDLLSDGIRNMIGMVADMAFRATKLNPHLGSLAAQETPGIVLIDEVDMHLHPEWQQVVLASLRNAFPQVQFIVTTHSPQVLSTVSRESVRMLGTDGAGRPTIAEPLANPYGAPSHTVLQRVMMVDPQPPIDELAELKELTRLVDQGRYESGRAGELMTRLVSRLGGHHEQIQRLQRSINRQRALAAQMPSPPTAEGAP